MNKRKLKVISRKSPLALRQLDEIFAFLPGLEYEISAVESFGDKHKEISLLDNPDDDIFTRELDEAILSGTADVGIHSAKDLPYPLRDGLCLAALTKSLDNTDALVSRSGKGLMTLPAGSRVGVSSPNRKSQINSVRPDLELTGIRGSIEERLAQLDAGKFDALIVAACALKRLGLSGRITEILPFQAHPLQGMLAAVIRNDRPDLKALFYPVDNRKNYGRVYVAGAGPGAADLITVRALDALACAGAVYYDDLLDSRILQKAAGEKIYVGKRKGNHSAEQEAINEMLYQSALEGKNTVRLKGGDPYIFGRAGEEVRYLCERHIDVEVIPGVTSAFAAAADSLTPLTYRGFAGDVGLVTAHTAKDDLKIPDNSTLVFYMGASSLKNLSESLIRSGRSAEGKVVLVRNSGWIDAKVEKTTIARMPETKLSSPLAVIVGAVAKEARQSDRYLFTGINPRNSIIKVPGKIVHYPLIETEDIPGLFVDGIEKYKSLVFTSKTAVRAFFQSNRPKGLKIFAIGPATGNEIEANGYRVDGIPEKADSGSFAEFIKAHGEFPALYPCSDLSDNPLHAIPGVEKAVIYHVRHKEQAKIDPEDFQGIIFTSPSTVDSFYQIYKEFPSDWIYYAIGPVTSRKLSEMHVRPEIIVNIQQNFNSGNTNV